MPIYEYQCNQCGKTTDVLQKVDDPAPATCAECGAEGSLKRKVSRTSFVLKGGGWYADLYGTPKKDKEKSETSSTGESEKPASSKPSSGEGSSGSGTSSGGGTSSSGGTSSGGGTSTPSAVAAAAPSK